MRLKKIPFPGRDRFSYEAKLTKRILQPQRIQIPTHSSLTNQTFGQVFGSFFKSLLLPYSTWLWIIATLIVAAMIHIIAVFTLPHIAEKGAWHRLAKYAPINTMTVLPAYSIQRTLPFLAPDINYSACRFDLSNGTINIQATLLHPEWSLALYTPLGDNFYTITGAELQRSNLNLFIVPQNANDENTSSFGNPEDIVVVKTAHKNGIALIRAPIANQQFLSETIATQSAASCAPF